VQGGPPEALSPVAAMREALRLIGVAPGAVIALGFSLYASLVAVCCGLGVLAAPWFLCELWALFISHGTGVTIPRSRAWIGAGLMQGLAVIVTWSLVLVALCVLRPELLTGGASALGEGRMALLVQALLAMHVAGVLVVGISVHVQYAPAILLERGGSVAGALLESARLVQESGALRTFVTAGVGDALQVGLPLVGIALVTDLGSPLAMALGGALLLLVSVAALLIAQGMLAASYLAVRGQLAPAPSEARATRVGMALWLALLVGTLAGPVAVSFAALKPVAADPAPPLPEASVLLSLRAGPEPSQRFIDDSALSVRLERGVASVIASDGGGAGAIPSERPVRVLRVARARASAAVPSAERSYAIDLELDDGRHVVTHVDEAGVRRDDSVERRIAARLRVLPALALLGALAWVAGWVAQALPAQARLLRTTASAAHALRRRAALQAAAWLLPATMVSWWVACSVLAG
jgi:hypothetical protein